jgi:putative membrane protein
MGFVIKKRSDATLLEQGEMKENSKSWVVTKSTVKKKLNVSIISAIWIAVLLNTLWAVLWTCLYMFKVTPGIGFGNLLITVLSIVVGLLLVFRTNTAYDRYWEARKLWGNLTTVSRNLARFIWIGCKADNEADINEKKTAINLILAFSVSTKRFLRDEFGTNYEDLSHLLGNFRRFDETPAKNAEIPLQISFNLSSFVQKVFILNIFRSVDLIKWMFQRAVK